MYNESCCLVVIASYVRTDGTDGRLIKKKKSPVILFQTLEVNAVLWLNGAYFLYSFQG